MPIGCGVNSHAEDCLCDVVLNGRVVASTDLPLRDRWFGHSILEFKGWDEPRMGLDNLLEFFEMQVAVKDRQSESFVCLPKDDRPNLKKKLTPEMSEYIGNRVIQKAPSGVIRREIDERYGVQISESHMSHLRKRLVQKWA